MRIIGFLGAAVLAAAGAGSAWAQAEALPAPGAPTVTIINKSADAPEAPSAPELTVTPAAPASAARAEPPASPAAPTRPAASSPAPAAQAPASPPGAAPAAAAAAPPAAAAAPPAAAVPAVADAAEAATPPPAPTLAVDIDLSNQRMTVSEHGVMRHTWAISSARYGYRTPTGTYQPTWMSKMWYSRQYDYAPMPHAIFFHKGVAIHGTYALSMLGRPASHGCVRLAPRNAAELFRLVSAHGKGRTEIVVHGTPVHTSPRVARSGDGLSTARPGRTRYLPPSYAVRGYAPAPVYGNRRAMQGRYAPPRPPRGLFNSGYSYGYGF